MSDQETDLNDIYEELIVLKDILDKIKDICETIIENNLEKKPSTIEANINLLKQDLTDLEMGHQCTAEKIQQRRKFTRELHVLWVGYILHPRIIKKNINTNLTIIAKNTSITLKTSQLLKFYYEKKQRLKEIYETYKDQEHIEELLRDIDKEEIDIIYEHHKQEYINEIEEKDKLIEEKDEIINLLERRLQVANNKLCMRNSILLERIRLLENKQVPTAKLLDIGYNPFDDLN